MDGESLFTGDTGRGMSMDPLAGQTLRGYQMCERLGSGGFGVVYRAYQPAVDREVAIKVIKAELADDPSFILRFEREAQIIARLEHPHIVPIYDYWREPGGAYLVMRLMRGGSLDDRARARPLDLTEALAVLRQVADALDSAHRRGVIHRDLKSKNVMLDEEGRAYLADFGLAIGGRGEESLAERGMPVGSPFYMPPEVVKGEPASPAGDIYSLGVVLFEMLTGIVPFGDSPPGVVVLKHVQEALPDAGRLRRDLPAAVNAVIQRATDHRPEQRYASATAMATALAEALAAAPAAAVYRPTVVNPYKGLRAFQEEDAGDFFGREALVQQLVDRLAVCLSHAQRFLAVVGPSGSGKSSVVRAGLVPALRRGALPGSKSWVVTSMFPGSSPLAELEQALLPVSVRPLPGLAAALRSDPGALAEAVEQALPADPEARLALIVDQFEETFTLTPEHEQRQFLETLWQAMTHADGRCLVIVTLRADFYDRPLIFAGWGRLFRDQAQVVLPPTADELREAIIRPAENAGLRFEEGLPEAILADVHDEPGVLPLLQYALTELVERRQDRLLTRAAYVESEGVGGALAQRAEALYGMLPPSGAAAARRAFMRLVALGEGTEDTRRRVPRRELIPAEATREQCTELDNVLGMYTRYRLLTADRDPRDRSPTVEVAHESLIRLWRRLREWLDAARDDLRLQRRLTLAAADWQAAGRDPSFLATGVRLQQLEALAANPELALNEEEMEYVRTSAAGREAQATAERERHERELETARRLAEAEKRRAEEHALTAARLRRGAWALAGMVIIVLIAALAAGYLARSASYLADQRARMAGTAQAASTQAVAESHSRATQQALAEDSYAHAESQRLAAEANGLLQRGESAELAALLAMRGLRSQYTGQADAALQRAIRSPFGLRAMVHPAPVHKVAYAPDGRTILTGAADGVVRLWQADSGLLAAEMAGHTDSVEVVAYSPNGRYAISGGDDHTARVWDLTSGGAEVIRLEGHTDIVNNLDVSPDGRTLATSGDDMTVRLWELPGGRPLQVWEAPAGPSAVGVSPDGRYLVVGMYTGECEVWDAATGEALRSLDGHTDTVWSVDFSPDGKTVLTAGNDTTARLWNLATGRPVRTLAGHTEAVFQAVFSPQGDKVLTGSLDMSGRLWDAATGRELRSYRAATSSLYSVAYSPDGRYAVTGSTDNIARLWDLEAPAELDTLAGHTLPVFGLAYSHNGRLLASGSNDMTIRLWDAATLRPLRVLSHAGSLYGLAFSPDDRLLAAATYTGAYLWDVSTGMTRTVAMPEEAAYWVDFTPDGRAFLAAMSDYAIHVYDAETGEELRTLAAETPVVWADISSDGRLLAVAGDDPAALLWDLSTGELLRTFEHPDAAVSVAFSPDGQTLLTGSRDMVGRLWDVESGELVRELVGHTSAIWMVAFSADGKQALTASQDKTARLWDAATGQAARVFPGHANSAVASAALAPGGRQVAIGSFDGRVNVAYTDVSALVQAACERLHRDLTAEERDAYGVTGGAAVCPPPAP